MQNILEKGVVHTSRCGTTSSRRWKGMMLLEQGRNWVHNGCSPALIEHVPVAHNDLQEMH